MLRGVLLAALLSSGLSDDLPEYRLPRDLVPRHYSLQVVPDLDKVLFQGQVWITVECVKTTDIIKLHSVRLTIPGGDTSSNPSIHLDNREDKLTVKKTTWDKTNDFFIIELEEKLQQGKTYILHLSYEGNLKHKDEGFYEAKYQDNNSNTFKWHAAVTKSMGTGRHLLPCLDEPDLRATFSIKIGHKDGLKAISNMPIGTHSRTDASGLVWDEFIDTPAISPDQVAFMVADLSLRVPQLPMPGTTVQLWARPDILDQMEIALTDPGRFASLIPRVLIFYRNYFQVDFPLPKLGLVALDGIKYHYEFGLMRGPEEMLLSPEMEMREVNRVAHDIARHWFGGLVSIREWRDVWYTWALAEHMATLAMDHVLPKWNVANRIFVSRIMWIIQEDKEGSPTVFIPIDKPEEIFDRYYSFIFFDKGPFLMHMVQLVLGDEVFQHGLTAFLNKFKHGSANHDDLWTCLTDEGHKSGTLSGDLTVQMIMEPWITRSCYPILTVTRNYQTGSADVSQRLYRKDKPMTEAHPEGCWWVPLSYSTASKLQFSETIPQHWLRCGVQSVQVDMNAGGNDWVIFNNRFAGLYKVNYDSKNWELITAALKGPDFATIDVMNRVQLVVDAMDLAKTGDLDYQTAFGILSYLRQETEYLPWKVAYEHMKEINEYLFHTPKYNIFKNFLQKLMTAIFENFKELNKELDEVSKIHQRYVIKWACEVNVQHCNEAASELFHQWKNSPDRENNPLPKTMRRVAYCKAVQMGGLAEWEFFQQYYKTVMDSAERKHVLNALSCTTDEDLLNRYLDWSIDEHSDIPSQYCFDAFRKVTSKEKGFTVAWDFLFNKATKIYEHSPRPDTITMYVEELASKVVTYEELKQLKNFVNMNKDLLIDASEEAEDGELEEAEEAFNPERERLSWLQENYEPIIEALEKTII